MMVQVSATRNLKAVLIGLSVDCECIVCMRVCGLQIYLKRRRLVHYLTDLVHYNYVLVCMLCRQLVTGLMLLLDAIHAYPLRPRFQHSRHEAIDKNIKNYIYSICLFIACGLLLQMSHVPWSVCLSVCRVTRTFYAKTAQPSSCCFADLWAQVTTIRWGV